MALGTGMTKDVVADDMTDGNHGGGRSPFFIRTDRVWQGPSPTRRQPCLALQPGASPLTAGLVSREISITLDGTPLVLDEDGRSTVRVGRTKARPAVCRTRPFVLRGGG